MRARITVLAAVVLSGNPTAAPADYAVDGLAVGTQLNFGSALYRESKCSPSDQFDGLTWCQKRRSDKERRGSYIAAYSLLHSRDGNILYINRSQEPAFLNPKEAEVDIQRYSGKIGELPRIVKMPHRSGFPEGLIAVWGKITLEPLDQESIKVLADGKSPKKGLLIDFLRNFVRSAKEGLPIYRIDGGPGFLWAASFDQKGRGTLRLAAVEVLGFSPRPDPAPVVVQPTTHQEQMPSGVNQTIESESLRADDLAISINKIAELEKAKADAERVAKQAEQAKLGAENAKEEIERAKIAEKMTSAAGVEGSRWENALYGSAGGLLVVLIASTIGFLINRRKAKASQPWEASTKPISQCQNSEAGLEPYVSSPGIAISEAAFERELEEQVATINAAQDEVGIQDRPFGGVEKYLTGRDDNLAVDDTIEDGVPVGAIQPSDKNSTVEYSTRSDDKVVVGDTIKQIAMPTQIVATTPSIETPSEAKFNEAEEVAITGANGAEDVSVGVIRHGDENPIVAYSSRSDDQPTVGDPIK
jgi:hypothetical protein